MRSRLCPVCGGIGLIETRTIGKFCYDCSGTGRVKAPDEAPVKGVGRRRKSPLRGEEGAKNVL